MFAKHLIKIPPRWLAKKQRIQVNKALYLIDFARDEAMDICARFKPPSLDISDPEAVKERLYYLRRLRDLLQEDKTHHNQTSGDKSAYLLAVERHVLVVESVESALENQSGTSTSSVQASYEVVYLDSMEGVPIALRKT